MLATLRSRLLAWPALAALAAFVAAAALLVPRIAGSDADVTPADRAFMRICRAHGGTPSLAPGSGDYVKDSRSCTVRYAGGTYEMYAVHAEGWSDREAAAAHRTCVAQVQQARAAAARGEPVAVKRYVWHPRSGICEERRH
jgi:hypothetical protein